MSETPRERAEQRSDQPEQIQPNPEAQGDPPEMPTLEEQHADAHPEVDADTLASRMEDRNPNQGSAEGEPDPGVQPGADEYTGREGGFGEGSEAPGGAVPRRGLPGDTT